MIAETEMASDETEMMVLTVLALPMGVWTDHGSPLPRTNAFSVLQQCQSIFPDGLGLPIDTRRTCVATMIDAGMETVAAMIEIETTGRRIEEIQIEAIADMPMRVLTIAMTDAPMLVVMVLEVEARLTAHTVLLLSTKGRRAATCRRIVEVGVWTTAAGEAELDRRWTTPVIHQDLHHQQRPIGTAADR
jgi:hypothetical protein